jgi:hypothetical protein
MKGQDYILKALLDSDMYSFNVDHYLTEEGQELNVASVEKVKEKANVVSLNRVTWHQRFGHANDLPDVEEINKGTVNDCDTCAIGKSKRKKFPVRKMSKNPLDVVYSDVCQLKPTSMGGGNYFVTFTDDCTRYSFVKVIKNKSDVFEVFINSLRREQKLT